MPIEQRAVRSAGIVSLDEKSARTLARGRISRIVADRDEQIGNALNNLPGKRMAWLRAVQRDISLILGEPLLVVGATNRHVVFLCLDPVDERPGWLVMTCCVCRYGREPGTVPVTLLSAHAIARLMERLRDVDPIKALKSELLQWTLLVLMSTERAPNAILPTKNGYFTLEKDLEENLYVFTTWLADRQLSDREQEILATLRTEKRLGFSEKLSEVV